MKSIHAYWVNKTVGLAALKFQAPTKFESVFQKEKSQVWSQKSTLSKLVLKTVWF